MSDYNPNKPDEQQPGVPTTDLERDHIIDAVHDYVASQNLVPPLSQAELRAHSDIIIKANGIAGEFRNYVCVLINNEVWRDSVARAPFDRRLLLLPQCLRHAEDCPAEVDEFGLLCKSCGRCRIGAFQDEAERLGYVILIAEGTAVVTSLVEAGKIDAIVGVSCLSVLERIFPSMEDAVIPSVAIPLLFDGCADTVPDTDRIFDAIRMSGNGSDRPAFRRMALDKLRAEVDGWFTQESLGNILGPAATRTERIAHGWLGKSGKRWRPFLAVCVYRALMDNPDGPVPDDLRKIAVAVECFHKASLVHDDIEDHDKTRYGEKTLHEEYGIPIALNAGDLLLGEGYRLITEIDAPAESKTQMLKVAAEGHGTLCIGQGEELSWRREPGPLPTEAVIDIFRKKTAPAFEVALHLGAIFAGAADATKAALVTYSEALGIAYQIRDDLFDFSLLCPAEDMTPSLQLATAWERAEGEARCLLERVWRQTVDVATIEKKLKKILRELRVESATWQLLYEYKDRAVRSLRDLDNATLKVLLRRVIGIIFSDLSTKERQGDIEARDASGRPVGSKTTA